MYMKIKLLRYAEEQTNMLKPVKKISFATFEKAGRYHKINFNCGSMLKVSGL